MTRKPVKLQPPEEHGYCRGCKKWRKTLYKGYCAPCREDYGVFHQKRPEGPPADALFVFDPHKPKKGDT